jgi:hypothetical protein
MFDRIPALIVFHIPHQINACVEASIPLFVHPITLDPGLFVNVFQLPPIMFVIVLSVKLFLPPSIEE